MCLFFFFLQAEDGIRDLVRSRGLGDVYKRQVNITALPDGIGLVILAKDHELLGFEPEQQAPVELLSLIHI